MDSTRLGRILRWVPAALTAGLLAPAAASAVVYCVPNNSVHLSCETPHAAIGPALNAAAASNGVADTVRIGPGTFSEDNLTYVDNVGDDEIDVVGAGEGVTVITRPTTTGSVNYFSFEANANSSISDLTVDSSNNDSANTDSGLRLFGEATVSDVTVSGTGTANARGFLVHGTNTIDDSTVDLPIASNNFGLTQNAGEPTITDSTLIADIGVSHSDAGLTTTLERTMIEAGLRGATTDGGTIEISNSVIDLGTVDGAGGLQAANDNPGTAAKEIVADHVTIVGGGTNSFGFRVESTVSTVAQISTGTLANSIIHGPTAPIVRRAGNSGGGMDSTANLTVSYSNYDDTAVDDENTANGSGAITVTPAGTQTNLAPALDANNRLLATSPLIDLGDPTAPATGATDIDGDARALDGSFDCSFIQRRDIGADEYAGAAQGIPAGCTAVIPPANPPTATDPCPPLREKVQRLNRRIKRADGKKKAQLKKKRRKVRRELRALGC